MVVFGVFWFVKLPDIDGQREGDTAAENAAIHKAPLIRQPHFVWGTITQSLYIAAQAGVNAFALNYILENAITTDASGAAVTDKLFSWYGGIMGARSPEATAAYVITVAMVLYAFTRPFHRRAAIMPKSSSPSGC